MTTRISSCIKWLNCIFICTDIVKTLQRRFFCDSILKDRARNFMGYGFWKKSCWEAVCCWSMPGILCLPDKTLACNTAHVFNAHIQAVPFLPSFSDVETDLSPQTGLYFFLTSHGIRSVVWDMPGLSFELQTGGGSRIVKCWGDSALESCTLGCIPSGLSLGR